MKTLSTIFSTLLLGTTLFSASSFAMEGAAAADEERAPRHEPCKTLFVGAFTGAEEMSKRLRDVLCTNALRVNIHQDIFSEQEGVESSSDEGYTMESVITDFLASVGKPWTHKHGIYSLAEAVSNAAPRRDMDPSHSPRSVSFVNQIFFGVEDIEKQRGSMTSAVASLLSLCPSVEGLSLNLLTVDSHGLGALGRSMNFSNLRSLSLTHAKMGDEEVARLFSSSSFPVLESLDLSHNEKITGSGFRGASLQALETLDLWRNDVNAEGLLDIVSVIPNVTTLSLGANKKIDPTALLRAFYGKPLNLTMFILDCIPLKDEGAEILADPTFLPNLQVLSLSFTEMSEKGLLSLATRSSTKLIDVRGSVSDDKRVDLQTRYGLSNLFFGGISHHDESGQLLTLAEIKKHYSHMFSGR